MMEMSLDQLLQRLDETSKALCVPMDASYGPSQAMARTAAYTIRAFLVDSALIEQTCGQALGYPWYYKDQENFPGATPESGVCIGPHVAATIAAELARAYRDAIATADDEITPHAKDPL